MKRARSWLLLLTVLLAAIPIVAQLEPVVLEEEVEEHAAAHSPSWWLPEMVSEHGGGIDRLFVIILWVTGISFILVEAALLLFLFRYRRRAGGRAVYTHGNTTLEIIWTIVPALILVVLTFLSRNAWADMKEGLYQDLPRDAEAFQVRVVPEQFQWNITYAGPDNRLGTEDDFTTINQLHIPVGRPVVVYLKSKDVLHSFFLPEMRVKQDALPNNTARVRFKPVKPGKWEIVCAELCGLGHYRMRGFVTVESEREVTQWLDEQIALAKSFE